MDVHAAQDEMREVYLDGSIGQLVSGALWLASALAATLSSPRLGIWVLVVGGMFIFPVAQLLLRLAGRRASVADGNPLRFLAMEVAFTVPLLLPLVGAATLYRISWFYPAMLLLVGAHYLPFVFLYRSRLYAVLGVLMMAAALLLPRFGGRLGFAAGAWLGALLLLVFGTILFAGYRRRVAAAA